MKPQISLSHFGVPSRGFHISFAMFCAIGAVQTFGSTGKIVHYLKLREEGAGVIFPTSPNLADILSRTHSDFENVHNNKICQMFRSPLFAPTKNGWSIKVLLFLPTKENGVQMKMHLSGPWKHW